MAAGAALIKMLDHFHVFVGLLEDGSWFIALAWVAVAFAVVAVPLSIFLDCYTLVEKARWRSMSETG